MGEAAEELGLQPGSRLPLLSDAQEEALTAIGRRLSLGERHHVRLLDTLEPIELPWARTPGAGHVAQHATLDLSVPAALADDPGAVVAALGVLLTRLSGKDRFHLGIVDGSWADQVQAAKGFVSRAAALEVAIRADDDLDSIRSSLGDDLDAARARLPFAHEVVARYPHLAQVPELAAGRLLPISVRLDDDGPPEDGVVVELQHQDGSWAIRYDAGLVDLDDARLLATCLEAVLEAMPSGAATVAQVDLLGPSLRSQVLEGWNDTGQPVPTDVCVHHLFEAQADRTPDVTAVVFEGRSVTYRELDEQANRLAHHLVSLGIGPDALVGVHVGRGLDLVVAVVAVHKAGGAYVPLDPVYPTHRLEHMIRDSGCRVILTEADLLGTLPGRDDPEITVVQLDADRSRVDEHPSTRPSVPVRPDHLAYCIYTSGSTGLPKGVLVEHRNAVNFFVGMDERVAHELPATWFAVTSLSFDISVLELLYTITRGFTVVVYLDREREGRRGAASSRRSGTRTSPMDFSLFYFSGDEDEGAGSAKYRLLLEGARFADEHGFRAVWTPERHFHAFGGLYPQPAVTGAAVAAITKKSPSEPGPWSCRSTTRSAWPRPGASSTTSPTGGGHLHRVGLAAERLRADARELRRPPSRRCSTASRWSSGSGAARRSPSTAPPARRWRSRTLPRPVQPELPVWVTTAGNPETYVQAGRIGANVLTHLLGQSVEQLAPKIAAYRQARADAGFDPDAGIVTLMLHTFVGDDEDVVREAVREPLKAVPRAVVLAPAGVRLGLPGLPAPGRGRRRRTAASATTTSRTCRRRTSTRCSSSPSCATTRRAACSARPSAAGRWSTA